MDKKNKFENCILKVKKQKNVNPYAICKSSIYTKQKIPEKYYYTQLNKGAKIEMEHTKNKEIAKKIASDHLKENINYYSKFNPSKKTKEYLIN